MKIVETGLLTKEELGSPFFVKSCELVCDLPEIDPSVQPLSKYTTRSLSEDEEIISFFACSCASSSPLLALSYYIFRHDIFSSKLIQFRCICHMYMYNLYKPVLLPLTNLRLSVYYA